METELPADLPPEYSTRRHFATPVIEAIERTLEASSFEHRVWWNRILTEVLDKFSPDVQPPAQGMDRHAFQFFTELASRCANPCIAVVDEAPWLQRHLGAVLLEASRQRPPVIESRTPVYGRPGLAALALSCDAAFFAWAQNALGVRLSTQMKMTYIYYECPGQRCRLHLDHPAFYEYNCVIGLRTSRSAEQPNGSRLRIVDAQSIAHDIDLIDGRAVLFNGSRLAHGRTPLAYGESVRLLSIGLNGADR